LPHRFVGDHDPALEHHLLDVAPPPGTSQWNKIEHRMFSAITMNLRGRPLETHEVVVETIAATATKHRATLQHHLPNAACPRRATSSGPARIY